MWLSPHARSGSPWSAGSTLMTSAPKSASCSDNILPATRRERSSTLTPVNGPVAFGSNSRIVGYVIANGVAGEGIWGLAPEGPSTLGHWRSCGRVPSL